MLELSELGEGTLVLVTLIPNDESNGEKNKSLENTPRHRDFIDELKANPIRVKNWLKLSREKLRDRF